MLLKDGHLRNNPSVHCMLLLMCPRGFGGSGENVYLFSGSWGHGLQSLPPSPKRAERKGRRRHFREAGSGHKQLNTVSCVDTFSIISKFSAQNSKI